MAEYPYINPAVPTVVKIELDNTRLPDNLFVRPDGTIVLRNCTITHENPRQTIREE
jgi:hypothetical protein